MAGETNRGTLKRQALVDLEIARRGLRSGVDHVKDEMSPKRILEENVRRYPVSSLVVALGIGFVIMKTILPSRENKRDSFEKVAKKPTLIAVLLSGIWAVTRGPLLGYARQQLTPYITQQFSRFQPPTKPESFE